MARKKKQKAEAIGFATVVVLESDDLKLAACRGGIDPYEVDETRMPSLDMQDPDGPGPMTMGEPEWTSKGGLKNDRWVLGDKRMLLCITSDEERIRQVVASQVFG